MAVDSSDINYSRILEQMMNRPLESAVSVSGGFAAEGGVIGAYMTFIIALLIIVLVIGLCLGVYWWIFVKPSG